MIEETFRLFAFGGGITPGGPSRWDVLDWDQRRTVSVNMDDEVREDEVAEEYLRKHIEGLEPDIYAIYVSADGQLISTSNDPDQDETFCTYYPFLKDVALLSNVKTVHRADLVEIDRLGPNVDLMYYNYNNRGEIRREVVFKYYFLQQFTFRLWDEFHISMRLPPHPNIAPFDRVVVDRFDGRQIFVGFTSRFIPGGTLEEDSTRVFKLKWLSQLLHVIDDLNLKYGIQHQDVAPRNLLVDPETDDLMIFDFNWAARIGYPHRLDSYARYWDQRDDVKGTIFTLYEIITRDEHFREVSWENQDPEDVQNIKEWIQHPSVRLDHAINEFRKVLDIWVEGRRRGPTITHYTEASEFIDWPDLQPPSQDSKTQKPIGESNSQGLDVSSRQILLNLAWTKRKDAKKEGRDFLDWQRPSQDKVPKGVVVLGTGALIMEDH